MSLNADIIHSIRIYGRFRSAKLFQYSFLDTELIYDQVEGIGDDVTEHTVTTIMPFPQSGIPILQARKSIYLEIIPEYEYDDYRIPNCEIGYGFLDANIRKEFNPEPDQKKGVSFLHKNGQRYAVFGIDQFGYSVNIVAPEG